MDRRPTIVNMLRARHRQRGGALIIMLVIFVLGASWLFIDAFGSAANRTTIDHRAENAAVLMQAKQALIGWVGTQAVEAGEDNPGRVPCPEAPGYIGTTNEGKAGPNCTLPAVGRLPWRTLGLPKLLDASGEPLWYVVSPGWALPNSTAKLKINSNSLGQLTLDGTPNAAVALVIAPGRPLNILASAGCAARVQSHNSGAPDFRDYLDCENATSPADASFATNGPSGSFNDQVLAVTNRDLLPGLEAAIAQRINREIVPLLRSVYAGPPWLSAGKTMFPYAQTFANPETATYVGVAGTSQGLLPFNQVTKYAPNCVPATDPACCDPATDSRCRPTLIDWVGTPGLVKSGGSGSFSGAACVAQGPTVPTYPYDAYQCDRTYTGDPVVNVIQKFSNVAMGLRRLDTSKIHLDIDSGSGYVPTTPSTIVLTLDTAGAVTVRVTHQRPLTASGAFRIRIEREVIGDHALLDANDPTTGWFARNEWYRLLYYAIAQGETAASLPSPACTTGTNCLTLGAAPDDNKRALLIFEGRSLGAQTRPSSTLSDFLETAENTNLDTFFEQPKFTVSVNDRVIVVDQN
jgi:hypothetical protein